MTMILLGWMLLSMMNHRRLPMSVLNASIVLDQRQERKCSLCLPLLVFLLQFAIMATFWLSVIWYTVGNCWVLFFFHFWISWHFTSLNRMKYPLAIVNWLFNQYGTDIRLGYDIFCAFIKTLLQSSLGAKTVAFHLQGVVPKFHGHAHN